MADYTDLVKDLRYCVDGDKECAGCKRFGQMCCEVDLMEEAADAIEELSKENERFAKMAKVFIDGMNDISDKCADIAGIQAEPPKEDVKPQRWKDVFHWGLHLVSILRK